MQLGTYLIPTAIYGLMFLGQKMPKSEASAKGLGLAEMFKDVGVLGAAVVCFLLALFFNGALGIDQRSAYMIALALVVLVGFMTRSQTQIKVEALAALVATTLIGMYFQQSLDLPILGVAVVGGLLLVGLGKITSWSLGSFLLFSLFIAHALVGAVELGTDGWIQNITGNLLTPKQGNILFIWTSIVMFSLRFCADFIEKKMGLSPVGILLVSSIIACVGLVLSSGVNSFGMAILALGVYAVGKTFFWPTMLAVASDRFPKTGAVAISFMGGIGMMSAGLIGSPGLGYAKDRFSSEELARTDKASYDQIKVGKDKEKSFLFFDSVAGFDGTKFDDVNGRLKKAREGPPPLETPAAMAKLSESDRKIIEASIVGDRKTLVADAAIPALMAAIYLAIMLYFKGIGGYKPLTIEGSGSEPPKA
jgi:hypothetical protein